MITLIFLILIGNSDGQFPDSEYCSIPCATGQHTICAYPPVSENCSYVESLMNPQRRQKILSLHNLFRNAVAGGIHPTQKTINAPSSNMRQLYWDLELEGIAERWASQCNVSTNDDCRDVARFSVGQVMSKSKVLTPSLDYYDTLFNMLWFAEVDNLSRKNVLLYKKQKNIKHVAQILNANTMRIGCTDVITKRSHGLTSIRVTICNYGPAIISGEEMYKIGRPCSNCPVGTKCRGPFSKYPHLCSEYRQFDIAEMKTNFKQQVDNGVVDLPALPNAGQKAKPAEPNQDQNQNEESTERNRGPNSRFNGGKRKLPCKAQYGSRCNNKSGLPNNQPDDDDNGGHFGQDDVKHEGKKELNPQSYPDFDDQNDDSNSDEDKNGRQFLKNDHERSGDGFQDNKILFGGRDLSAGSGSENQTTSSPDTEQETTSAHSGEAALEEGTMNLTTNATANVTTNATANVKKESSSSPRIRPSRWYVKTLISTVIQLTFAMERTNNYLLHH